MVSLTVGQTQKLRDLNAEAPIISVSAGIVAVTQELQETNSIVQHMITSCSVQLISAFCLSLIAPIGIG